MTDWPVHHVVPSIAEEAAGPSYSVPALAIASAESGRDVTIHTSGAPASSNPHVRIDIFPHGMAGKPLLQSLHLAPGLKRKMDDLPVGSIVHGHGLWLLPNVISMAAGARRGIKVVHAPRGMLGKGALTFSAKRKRLFWHILQKRAAAHVDCWHATSEKEIEDIRNFGLRQPIALVPNGIDIPPIADLNSAPREKTILFLGRIHPKKGIDTLLQAWADLEERFPDWQLDIAGPADNAYGAEYKAFIQSRGLRRARLIGPLYGDAKSLAYERAAVFVLPTLDENFGLTVAEALVRGTPAIVSQGAPWAGLTEHDCGWWHPIGEQPLRDSMREAMQCGADVLEAKGRNGRKWVKTAFGWPALASQMSGVYDWLAGQSDKPDCVFID